MDRDFVRSPLERLGFVCRALEADDALVVLFHAEIVVDMPHGLNHEPDRAVTSSQTFQGNIGKLLEGPIEQLQKLAIDSNKNKIMGLDPEGILKSHRQDDLVDHNAKIKHLKLLGLENEGGGRDGIWFIPIYCVED